VRLENSDEKRRPSVPERVANQPRRREAAIVHLISRLPIFWRLAPFPFAGLPVVAGDTTLNHFIAPFVACHDERDEIAAAKAKPAKGGNYGELRQLTHRRTVLFKPATGSGEHRVLGRGIIDVDLEALAVELRALKP